MRIRISLNERGLLHFITVKSSGSGDSGEGKVVVGLAEPIPEQRAWDMVGSARENNEPRECRLGGRMTCMHEFYCTRAFRGNEAVDCAVLREMNLTA